MTIIERIEKAPRPLLFAGAGLILLILYTMIRRKPVAVSPQSQMGQELIGYANATQFPNAGGFDQEQMEGYGQIFKDEIGKIGSLITAGIVGLGEGLKA